MSKGAKKLFMTQPAVSQAIKELEAFYEAILFDRFPQKLYTDMNLKRRLMIIYHRNKCLPVTAQNFIKIVKKQ